MKTLLINDTNVVLDNTYFPFTHKIYDLDEPTSINLPITKTVQIKRCPVNDEIFGYIGSITRTTTNTDNDNKIYLSFNQIKKCEYKLLYNSEIVSEGLVEVLGVDDENYNIELSDYITEFFESELKLNDLELINPVTNLPLNEKCFVGVVKDMLNSDIVPLFGKGEYTSSKIICNNKFSQLVITDLPQDMGEIDVRTFKPYQLNYGTKLTNIFDSIESKMNIKFEDREIVEDIYFSLGKPKNEKKRVEIELNDTFGNVFPTILSDNKLEYYHQIPLSNPVLENGNYYFDTNIEWVFTTEQPTPETNTLTTYKGTTFNKQIPRGTKIGELSAFLRVTHKLSNEFPILATKWIKYRIELLADINVTWDYIGGKNVLIINNHFIIKQDLLADAFNAENAVVFGLPITDAVIECYLYNVENSNDWDIENILTSNTVTQFTGLMSFQQPIDSPCYVGNIITCSKTPLEQFRSGDRLNSKTLLPKMTVRDFIINTIKTFDYDSEFRNGFLHIFKRKYKVNDNIVITNVKEMDIDKIKFNIIKLYNGKAESELITQYEELEGKKWGEKIVYTNYSIRNKIKEIELPYKIPFFSKAYHYFGYDMFGRYFNGGYSKFATGSLIGTEDSYTIGYLNYIKDDMVINDDWILLENKDYGGEDYSHVNMALVYDDSLTDSLKWRIFKTNTSQYSSMSWYLDTYTTLSPYLFDNDGTILKSLDMSKMKYNYADIMDWQYPESTTMYERFYKRYIQEWYDLDNHIIQVDIMVFGKLDLFGIYNYMNSNYIIIEVPEWDKSELPTLIEGVKMIRIKNIENYVG
jgi:hypothetical protein